MPFASEAQRQMMQRAAEDDEFAAQKKIDPAIARAMVEEDDGRDLPDRASRKRPA